MGLRRHVDDRAGAPFSLRDPGRPAAHGSAAAQPRAECCDSEARVRETDQSSTQRPKDETERDGECESEEGLE